jgi:intermediate peptidase
LFQREDPESLKFDHPAHFTVKCSRKIYEDEEHDFDYSNEDEIRYLKDPNTGVRQKYQLPIVVLVTSFKRPKTWTDLPKLHLREIETFFHEMGHAIHSMMARTDFQHVSGTRVPVDFVEVPSMFLEMFASKLTFSKSEPYIDLSRETVPTMAEIIETQNQIQLSILDLEYHSLASNQFPINSTNMLSSTQSKFHCLPYVPGTAWQTNFSHLYSYGSYYYSYVWSKRWSLRIHQKLLSKTHPQEWRQVGEELNSQLFGLGGSRDPWIGLNKLGIVMDGEQEGDYRNSKYENMF